MYCFYAAAWVITIVLEENIFTNHKRLETKSIIVHLIIRVSVKQTDYTIYDLRPEKI